MKEAPAQRLRPYIKGELKWTNKTPDGCLAEYKVTFKNVGNTPIRLGQPKLKAWLSTQKPSTSAIQYFNPHEVMNDPPLINAPLTKQEFGEEYTAGVGDDVTNTFLVRRNPGQIMFVSLEFPQPGEKEPAEWVDYSWDYVCDEPSPTPKNNRLATHLRRQQGKRVQSH